MNEPKAQTTEQILAGVPMLKLKPLPPEEEARRQAQRERERAESSAHRLRELMAEARAPKRQLANRELDRSGPWGEKYVKILGMLGTGFIVALIRHRGNGKTQMAVELIRHNAEQSKRSLYATATEFFMDVKATYRTDARESERDVLNRYGKPALLVLDEIGRRGETDWEDRLLFELVDRRYRDVKDTLLLSNQDGAQFETAVGAAITSRLNETGGIVECDWESFR